MPHYSSEQQSLPMHLAPPDLDLAELELMVKPLQELLPPTVNSTNCGPQYSQSRLFQPEEYLELARNAVPSKDNAPTTYTFVNVQTSTGRRNWAAETQIRSHAMKRVQQQRRKSKRSLQTVSGNSSAMMKLSCPCWHQDPGTCMCPCMESASTVDRGTLETWAPLNMTKDRNATLLTSSSDRLSRTGYCHCDRVKFTHPAGANIVAMPLLGSIFRSSFLSLFNKPGLQITPRMESLLHYRKSRELN
jgi:hypothetical protein